MKIPFLPAIRWFRDASKSLPAPRYDRQTVPERCRETFASEVNWFAEMISRANRRDR